jgi:hypothetical protein
VGSAGSPLEPLVDERVEARRQRPACFEPRESVSRPRADRYCRVDDALQVQPVRGACSIADAEALRAVFDPSQPGLSPVGIDRPGAGAVVIARADDAFEDHAVARDRQHPSGLLVDDLFDSTQHPRPPSAVLEHLPVEAKSLRRVTLVQRRAKISSLLLISTISRTCRPSDPVGVLPLVAVPSMNGYPLATPDEAEARE